MNTVCYTNATKNIATAMDYNVKHIHIKISHIVLYFAIFKGYSVVNVIATRFSIIVQHTGIRQICEVRIFNFYIYAVIFLNHDELQCS